MVQRLFCTRLCNGKSGFKLYLWEPFSLYLLHDTQEVTSQMRRMSSSLYRSCQTTTGQIDHFRRVVASDNTSVTVKVTADSHHVRYPSRSPCDPGVDGIQDMSRTLFTEEAAIQAYLYHASPCGLWHEAGRVVRLRDGRRAHGWKNANKPPVGC